MMSNLHSVNSFWALFLSYQIFNVPARLENGPVVKAIGYVVDRRHCQYAARIDGCDRLGV